VIGCLFFKPMRDPGTLLYSGDWITEMMFMTLEQRGRYITAYCYQHAYGHLDAEKFAASIGDDSVLKNKFIQDSAGLWYHPVWEEIIEKRKKYSQSRRDNINKRYEGGKCSPR
jgi:hypothetical protein